MYKRILVEEDRLLGVWRWYYIARSNRIVETSKEFETRRQALARAVQKADRVKCPVLLRQYEQESHEFKS